MVKEEGRYEGHVIEILVIMIHQLLNSKWLASPSKVEIGDPAVGSDGRCGEGHRRRELDREGRIWELEGCFTLQQCMLGVCDVKLSYTLLGYISRCHHSCEGIPMWL